MPNSSVVLVYWFFALLVCINIKNVSSDYCPDTVPGLLYVSAVLDSTLYFRSPIPAHENHVNAYLLIILMLLIQLIMFDEQIHTSLDIYDCFFIEFPLECIGLILLH